jgi:hypothetical protein
VWYHWAFSQVVERGTEIINIDYGHDEMGSALWNRTRDVPYTVCYVGTVTVRVYPVNIRDGAQPYKQHTLITEVMTSRTKAVKVNIVDIPN